MFDEQLFDLFSVLWWVLQFLGLGGARSTEPRLGTDGAGEERGPGNI